MENIRTTSRYSALLAIPNKLENPEQAKRNLIDYIKENDVQSKLSKFVITDLQTKRLLGLSNKKPGIYLLTPKESLK